MAARPDPGAFEQKPFAVKSGPVAITMPNRGIEITVFKIMYGRIGIDTQVDFRVTF